MVGRLALVFVVLVTTLAAAGCSGGTPNDPMMSPKEADSLRKDMYTPEQMKDRANRPR